MRYGTLLILLLLGGCANPFATYYTDMTGGMDITQSDRVILSGQPPTAYRGTDVEADTRTMRANGYGLVGYSHFNAPSVMESQMMAQATAVNAEVVVHYSEYTNTVSGSIPLTTPKTETSTSNIQGSAYGSGGYTNFSGTATTTTNTTQTTYIPYNTRRYDFMATYWVKMKPPSLGLYVEDLLPETRRAIGSNKGVFITTVVNDSPAFMADILAGDIVKAINGNEVIDSEDFMELISLFRGQQVSIDVLRGDETVTKDVQLRP